MQLFSSILTASTERKFEYLRLASFCEDSIDPFTKKQFRELARELPTANLGYLFAIIKEKQSDGFTLTPIDAHSFQEFIVSEATKENSKLFQTGIKVYWYFMSSFGQACTYFLGSTKPDKQSQKAPSVEQELFYQATRGNLKALLKLANRLYSGTEFLPVNKELALACLDLAAHKGDAEALYLRGVARLNGDMPARNFQHGLDDIKSAAFANLPEALFTLGTVFEKGLCSLPQSTPQAFGYYKRAAKLNFPEAFVKLGHFYAFGKQFTPVPPKANADHYTAMRYYRKGAQLGNREAMVLTANLFESNPHFLSSPDLAAKYLYMAAQAGCQESRERLASYRYFKDRRPSIMDLVEEGLIFTSQSSTTPPEYDWGNKEPFLDPFDQYRQHKDRTLHFKPEELIKLHDKDIAFQSGMTLLHDVGVRISLHEMKIASLNNGPLGDLKLHNGFQLVALAALLQNANAHFVLGHARLNNLPVPLQEKTPFQHFQTSAELRSSSGAYALAHCYKNGIGCVLSLEDYLKHLKSAADQGHTLAVHEIGLETEHENALLLLEKSRTTSDPKAEILEALAILHKLAKNKKMARAQFTLGILHFKGEFVQASPKAAELWIHRSLKNRFIANADQLNELALLRSVASQQVITETEEQADLETETSSSSAKKRGRPKKETLEGVGVDVKPRRKNRKTE